MAIDCETDPNLFYSTLSCDGLGTKLKDISVSGVSGAASGVPNDCLVFEIADWILDDKFYKIDILPDQHNQGDCPMISVQERLSGVPTCYQEVGVDEFYKEDGTITIKVICLPDCRFPGRIVIDG